MKKIFWGVAGLMMALVVLAISYGAYLNLAGESNIASRMADRRLKLYGATARVREMHARTALGTVSLYSDNMTDAITLIEGRIQAINVRENDQVVKGQVLFEIANEQHPLRLRQAEIDILKADQNVVKAEGDISKAEAELARATNDYDRYGSLLEYGAASPQKFDEVEAVYKAAQVNLDIARVQKEQALAEREYFMAQKEQLLIQGSRCQVTAPLDGKVLLVYKQLGSYVNAGTPLALVGDFQQMLFVVAVSDEDARGLEVGQRAQMEFDRADIVKMYDMKVSSGSTAGNPVCMARIVDISPAFSEPVAMRQIIWEVDNRAGILIPQTYSNVYLQSQETHRALSIPIAALDSARSEVFVAYEDGRLERRHVETGFEDGVYVEILSGLFEGEVVIVSGTDGLTDGVKAKVNLEQEES